MLGYMVLAQFLTGSVCLFKSTVGIPCPGCGMTRAVENLFEGHFALATRYHPLVWLLFPLLTFIAVLYFKGVSKDVIQKIVLGACFLMVGVYIVRMILYFPHYAPMDFNDGAVTPQIVHFFRWVFGMIRF